MLSPIQGELPDLTYHMEASAPPLPHPGTSMIETGARPKEFAAKRRGADLSMSGKFIID